MINHKYSLIEIFEHPNQHCKNNWAENLKNTMNFIDYNILNVSKRRCDVRAHHELRGDTWLKIIDFKCVIV